MPTNYRNLKWLKHELHGDNASGDQMWVIASIQSDTQVYWGDPSIFNACPFMYLISAQNIKYLKIDVGIERRF